MAALDTVLVDARPVDHPTARQRGIGRYVTGLLRGLHDIDAPLVALHGSDLEAEVLADAIPGLRLEPWSPQTVRAHAAPSTWYIATQLMLHPIPLDPIPSVITQARLPVAAVMYDVIPYRFPAVYQVEPNARRQALLRAPLARTVDTMLAISQFSADTAVAELDYPAERMAVIGAGVDEQFVTPATRRMPRPDRVLPAPVGRYVVSVTGGDERKNTEGLLRAWGLVDASIRAGRHLVVATAHSPEVLRRWQRWAAEAGVADEVIFTGSITDDEMVAVLQHAELAVMPSTEEGFGLPVVEAAACGCPAICSNVSSLPEVLSEPRAEFDPFDPASIAHAIERALVDDAHRAMLVAAGEAAAARWRWTNVARDTLDALTTLGPRWPQTVRKPAARIAIAGPFRGSVSGIGIYDERVVEALERRHAAGDGPATAVFVDLSGSSEPALTRAEPDAVPGTAADAQRTAVDRGHDRTAGTATDSDHARTDDRTDESRDEGDVMARRMPVRALGRYAKPWDYDHVVAVLGSSPHHIATAELAERTPCHVWLHEASLVGVHVGLAHLSGSHGWAVDHVRAVAESSESAAVLAALGDDDLLDAPGLDRRGITLLGATLDRARSVIVSSDEAAEVVRRIRPHGSPVLVLPHAFPPARAPHVTPPGADVVSVGWLDDNKAPGVVVEALAKLASTPAPTLTFVGPAVDATVSEVVEIARRLGVADRVHFTGRLSREEYRDRIAQARVGVQLRTTTRGEMSGAIADLLALGVPTVTTMATAGPASPGVRVVGLDPDEVAAALSELVNDDAAWSAGAHDAHARATAWTFDDVATSLLDWLADAADLAPGTVRRCGPPATTSR